MKKADFPKAVSDYLSFYLPSQRNFSKNTISYYCDTMKLLLAQPDRHTRSGRRDLVLLSLLYDSGARVQELADLTVASIRLVAPAQVTLLGKGSKARVVPLMNNSVQLLQGYIAENRLDLPHKRQYPLFTNQRNEKLIRAGICYVLKKYAILANQSNEHFPDLKSITPHVLRHTCAITFYMLCSIILNKFVLILL